jgi:transposase
VPPDRDADPVRIFSTFTEDLDLERMAEWLLSCGITTVAMESTGVYWIPPYDVERHGLKPCLVDARGMKNVPRANRSPLLNGINLRCCRPR